MPILTPAPVCVQAAKTYLEKHYESFPGASVEELVCHGLRALAATLSEGELTKANVGVAVVGTGAPYAVLEDDDVEPYLAVRRQLDAEGPGLDAGAVAALDAFISRDDGVLCCVV